LVCHPERGTQIGDFGWSVLKKIFVPDRDEVHEVLYGVTLHMLFEYVHNSCCPPDKVKVFNVHTRNEIPQGIEQLASLGVGGIILLK